MFGVRGPVMMRQLALVFLLFALPLQGNAAESADELFKEALATYNEASKAGPEVQLEAYETVMAILDRIVDDFPTSDLAVNILLGETVQGMNIEEVAVFVASAGTSSQMTSSAASSANPTPSVASKQTSDAANSSFPIEETARIRLVQENLNRLGCAAGSADGVVGQRTLSAYSRYLEAKEISGGSYDLVTNELLALLASDTGTVCKPIPAMTSRSTARSQVIKGVRWTYRPGTTYPYCKPCGRDYQCRAKKRDALCQMYPPSGWQK